MRKLLILLGLAGAAAAVVKRLTSSQSNPVWHTPAPSGGEEGPPLRPVPDSPAAASTAVVADDAAGATPDEAAADLTEEPHASTTPDAPLEEVELKDE